MVSNKQPLDLYRALFESASHPIVVYDADATIVLINPAGAATLQQSVSACLGRPLRDFRPTIHDLILEHIGTALATQQPSTFLDYVDDPQTSGSWHHTIFQPLPTQTGAPELVQSISYALTNMRETKNGPTDYVEQPQLMSQAAVADIWNNRTQQPDATQTKSFELHQAGFDLLTQVDLTSLPPDTRDYVIATLQNYLITLMKMSTAANDQVLPTDISSISSKLTAPPSSLTAYQEPRVATISPIANQRGQVLAVDPLSLSNGGGDEIQGQLHESQLVLDTLINNLPVVLFVFDNQGLFLYAAGRALQEAELEPENLIGHSVFDLFAEYQIVMTACGGALAGFSQHYTTEILNRFFESWLFPIKTPDGHVERVIGIGLDITERIHTERQLREQEARFRSLSACSPLGIFLTDIHGDALYTNPRLQAIAGFSFIEGLGAGWVQFVHSEDRQRAFDEWCAAIAAGQELVHQYRFVHPKRGIRWVRAHAAPIRAEDGTITGYVGAIEDITSAHEHAALVEYLAYTDTLTDLPNRNSLYQVGKRALHLAHAQGREILLLFLDLDRFKTINDTLGHNVGDELLIQVATRMQRLATNGQHLFRLGGDEFAFLLTEADLATAHQKAQDILEQIQRPFVLRGETLYLDGSIGIASSSSEDNEIDPLLTRADVAMYRSKAEGGGVVVYNPDDYPALRQRVHLESALRSALQFEELHLYFQPIVRLQDGSVLAFEALLRWHHPTRGVLTPGTFLGVAEEAHLMPLIDQYVLVHAVHQIAEWQRQTSPTPTVTVNLTASSLSSPTFIAMVDALLTVYRVAASQLIVEITEHTAMRNLPITRQVLTQLRQMGVRIALDDFGSGYASLTYLRQLPIDFLKLDYTFVAGIGNGTGEESIIRALLLLGAELNLTVIVEGVETSVQRDWLHQTQCHYGQGYLFGRPSPTPIPL